MQNEFLTSTLGEAKDRIHQKVVLARGVGRVVVERVRYAMDTFDQETGMTLDKDQVHRLNTGPLKLSEIRQAIEQQPPEQPTDIAV